MIYDSFSSAYTWTFIARLQASLRVLCEIIVNYQCTYCNQYIFSLKKKPASSGDAPAPSPAVPTATSVPTAASAALGRGSVGRGAFLQGLLQGATSSVSRGQPTGKTLKVLSCQS